MVSVVAKLAKRSVRREVATNLPVGDNSTGRSNASEKKAGKACATIHSQVIRT